MYQSRKLKPQEVLLSDGFTLDFHITVKLGINSQ